MKPEISQALTSLLDKMCTTDDAKIMCTAVNNYYKPTGSRAPHKTTTRPNRPTRSCPLCKHAGRSDNAYFLRRFLLEQDRNYIAKARQIADIFDDPSKPETRPRVDESISDTDDIGSSPSSPVFRIQTRQSPYLDVFYAHHPARVTINSGATGNMIRHTVVQRLGRQVTPSSQFVYQADDSSLLHVVGAKRFPVAREDHTFTFECLFVENLDVDVLAGTPFMESNDVSVRPAKRQVILGDGTIHNYSSQQPVTINSTARRAIVFRSPPTSTTNWLGEWPRTVNSDTDSSSDEALPAQPVSSPPSPPVIPSAILTPATQEDPDSILPADQYEPCEDTPPDPVLDSPTTGNASDACSFPRRSTRARRRPARYDEFFMDRN
ncbi:hypothetical protein AWC38_SpisGene22463 [Stylophora pistillata]|uniref:Uncharacterized protein n=1 Tax=Stylophora pistillata TaxID=50429 RepID=A0A2B4RAP9_STYPI|nr:hypothetical protein AWC38_SpisGene22463 [Stylophora pistillata]